MSEKKQSEKEERARILVVDDHPLIRQGLIQLLDREEGVEVCGEAETREETLAKALELRPDLAILDLTEEVGLVLTVSNIMEGLDYVCNCCGCCCGILRGVTEHGVAESVAHANYYAVIDPDECMGCLTCMDRCHVGAISLQDEYAVVDREKCIGCGLCVTGCLDHVAKLVRKPDDEIVHPPGDFSAWEDERLHNRGLSE